MKKILSFVRIFALALLIGFGVSYAFAWTNPTQTPPNGNPAAPINVGTVDQVKDAGLSLNKLAVFGQVQIQDGTQGAGKILTSDTNGTASWQAVAAGGGPTLLTAPVSLAHYGTVSGYTTPPTTSPYYGKWISVTASGAPANSTAILAVNCGSIGIVVAPYNQTVFNTNISPTTSRTYVDNNVGPIACWGDSYEAGYTLVKLDSQSRFMIAPLSYTGTWLSSVWLLGYYQ